MEKTLIERSFTKYVYLEILTWEFKVSILDMYDFYKKSADKIANLKDILNSGDPKDVQQCLALMNILTHGKGKYKGVDMIDKYYGKYAPLHKVYTSEEIKGYIEKYKLPLLTALLYDDDFYDEVKGWCKEIFEYAGESENKKDNENKPGAGSNVVDFPNSFDFETPDLSKRPAAKGLGNKFKEFASVPVPIFHGKLVFYGREEDEQFALEIHFEFQTEQGKEDNGRVPFFLDVYIIPKYIEDEQPADAVKISLRKDVPDKKLAIRSSRRTGIDYTKGLKGKIIRIEGSPAV